MWNMPLVVMCPQRITQARLWKWFVPLVLDSCETLSLALCPVNGSNTHRTHLSKWVQHVATERPEQFVETKTKHQVDRIVAVNESSCWLLALQIQIEKNTEICFKLISWTRRLDDGEKYILQYINTEHTKSIKNASDSLYWNHWFQPKLDSVYMTSHRAVCLQSPYSVQQIPPHVVCITEVVRLVS